MGRGWLVGLALLTSPALSAPDGVGPRWPLDLPPNLTSSFGEYRADHLHAGIDLGTGGVAGAPCRAVGDGSVVRLRMSPFGYGKALYVQLDRGPLVVYAHLSRFAAPMAARARAEQVQRGRYTFDVTLSPGEIRVRRGEIVAWSGQTGVGFPHLHFEVRDGDVARNPQTVGWPVPDSIPPVVAEIAVTPLDPGSHVAGGLETRALPANGPPLVVGGRIGFSVRAWDHATSREHRQAPYRYLLRVDGQPVYRLEQERFDYADNHLCVLEYDQRRLVERDERVQLLYLREGDRLPGRDAAPLAGGALLGWAAPGVRPADALLAGMHEVEVEVGDVAGHVTVRRASVRCSERPTVTSLDGEAREGVLRWTCRAWDPDLCVEAAGESLRADFAVSRDLGATWKPVQPAQVQAAPEGHMQWVGDTPWDGGSPIAFSVRLCDRAGLEAVETLTRGTRTARAGEFPIAVRSRWIGAWLEVEVEPAAAISGSTPVLCALDADGKAQGGFSLQQVDLRRYRAIGLAPELYGLEVRAAALDGREGTVRLPLRARWVQRDSSARVEDLRPGVAIDIPPGALMEDVALRVETVAPSALGLVSELHPAGPIVAIEPRTAALDKPVRVLLRARPPRGVPVEHIGLFWVNRGGDLKFLSAARDSSGALVGETRFLSRFAALADTTPPRIGPLRVQGGGKRPLRLRFTVRDAGADLADGGIEALVDGGVAIPEWDPETGEVIVEPPARLAAGKHRLGVVATDRLGNRRARVLKFTVP